MKGIDCSREIMGKLQLESATLHRNNKDTILFLRKLSPEAMEFMCPEQGFSLYEKLLITMNTKYGTCRVEVEIQAIRVEGQYVLMQGDFRTFPFEKFRNDIEDIMTTKNKLYTRKEDRILCTKDTIAALNINPHIPLVVNGKEYRGYVQDISGSGIKIITEKELINTQQEIFYLKMKFDQPKETIISKGKLVRKERFMVENALFGVLAFSLQENLRLLERIAAFLKERDLTIFRNTN